MCRGACWPAPTAPAMLRVGATTGMATCSRARSTARPPCTATPRASRPTSCSPRPSWAAPPSPPSSATTRTGTPPVSPAPRAPPRPCSTTARRGPSPSRWSRPPPRPASFLRYNAAGQRSADSLYRGTTFTYGAQFTYRGAELGQAVVFSGTTSYTDTDLDDGQGAPLELIRQTKVGNALTTARYWYVLDGRGDVVALTDSSGSVVDRYAYGVWGSVVSSSEAVPQRLRYAGYWYDQELNWYWVGVRYYSPSLKRWLQPDPSMQDGVRTYVYVGDDPVDRTDPTGFAGGTPTPSPTATCHSGQSTSAARINCPPASNAAVVVIFPAAGGGATATTGDIVAAAGPIALIAVGGAVLLGLSVAAAFQEGFYTGPYPNPSCNTSHGNSGQGPPCLRGIVRGRAPLQPGPKRRRHIAPQGMIAPVRVPLPAALGRHLLVPARQQRGAAPVAAAQRRPGPPYRPHREAARAHTGDRGAPRRQQLPADQHPQQVQPPQGRPHGQRRHQRTQQRQHAIHCLGPHRILWDGARLQTPALYHSRPVMPSLSFSGN